jgi:hypothetical protein
MSFSSGERAALLGISLEYSRVSRQVKDYLDGFCTFLRLFWCNQWQIFNDGSTEPAEVPFSIEKSLFSKSGFANVRHPKKRNAPFTFLPQKPSLQVCPPCYNPSCPLGGMRDVIWFYGEQQENAGGRCAKAGA